MPIEANASSTAERGALADGHHGDHRADADDHPQRGEERAQLVPEQRPDRDPQRLELVHPHLLLGEGGRVGPRRDLPAIAGDVPVADHDDSPDERGDVRLVGDQDDGDAALAQLLEERHHLHAGPRVEVARGLVGEDELRLADQRAGDGHPLLLPAREAVRGVVQPVAEPHPLERLGRPAPPLCACRRRRRAAAAPRSRARWSGKEVEALEDEPQPAVADARPARRGRAAPRRCPSSR